MTTRHNYRLRQPLLIASILQLSLLIFAAAQVNTPYGNSETSPCKECEECKGETHEPAVSAGNNSVDLTFNLGGAGYERPNMFSSFFSTAGANADDPHLPQGVEGIRSYFDQSPATGLWAASLRLKSPVINADVFKPDILTAPNTAMKLTVLKTPAGVIRQVLTRQFLVDILPLDPQIGEGFTVKWYSASEKGELDGLYDGPAGDAEVMKTVTVRNPNHATVPVTYTTMEVLMEQDGRKTLFRYTFTSTSHTLQTVDVAPDDSETILTEDTITYTSGTPESNAQDRIRTIRTATLSAAGEINKGITELPITSRTREVYANIGGKKRLVSLTRLSGETGPDGLTTHYGYYDTLTTNPTLHARPRWQVNPDGSWIVWDINTSGTSPVIKEITPFTDATMTVNTSNHTADPTTTYSENLCRVVTRIISGPQMLTTVKVLGETVATTTELFTNGSLGERVLKTVRSDGSTDHTTYTAFNIYGNPAVVTNPAAGAACIAWQTHGDGTATVYTYLGNSVTAVTGAASGTGDRTRPGITAGTCSYTTFNETAYPISEARFYGTSTDGVAMESWSSDPAKRDIYGRPTEKTWTFGTVPGGTEFLTYDCCGLASRTTLDGTTTTWFRDPLKRVYETRTQVGPSESPVILTSTTTAYGGLATETETNGTFVSATARSLDGLTTTTTSPSRKSGDEADRLVTRSVTDPATRTTTESYLSGTNSWTGLGATTTYRDGRTASSTDAENHTTTYAYGVSESYGGLLTTVTSGTLDSETHTDRLGRTRLTVSPGSGPTTYTYNALGQLYSVADADGVTTTYGYNSKGERTTTTRQVPNPDPTAAPYSLATVLTTGIATAPNVHGDDALGTCYYQKQELGGVKVSETYRTFDGLKSATTSLQGDTLTVSTRPTTTSGGNSTTTHPDGTITYTTTSLDRTVVTTSSYAKDAVIGTTTPIAYTTTTYDSLGRLLTVTDSRTQAAGQTAYSVFTESGTPLTTTTPDGTTTTTFDLLGRATETYLPGHTPTNPRVTHTSYYPSGRVAGNWGYMTYPTFSIYNEQGRRIELRTYRDLTSEPTEETGAAVPATEDDPEVPATYSNTTWNYDPDTGRLTSKLDNDNKGPSYLYTAAGRLWKRTSARNIVTEYTYTHGYPTKTDYYDSTPDVTITYDSLGRRESVTNTLATSTFEYAADLAVDTETITYDLPDRPAFTRVLNRATRTLGRDTGWELGISGADLPEHQASYAYNTATGFLETVAGGVVPDTTTTDLHDYNASDTFTYGYTYTQITGGPRVGATTAPEGGTLKPDHIPYTLTKSGGILQTIRTYEPTRDVLASIQNIVDTTVVSMYDYTTVNGGVNNLGQRMGVQTTFNLTGTATTQATAWGYDSLGQLTAANMPGADLDRTYAYDSIGNRLTAAKGNFTDPGVNSTFTSAFLTEYFGAASSANPPVLSSPGANALNQYAAIKTPSATVKPAHDDDGNMTHGPIPTSPTANRTLVWDGENRLIEVKNSSDVTLVKYTYDALSRRIATKVGTANPTLYIYDGWNCIADYAIQDSAFEIQNSNLWGLDLSGSLQGAGGVGGLLAVNDGTTSYYPTYDGNGNVSEYLEADGDVAAHYEYDPFGNDVTPSPPTGVTYGDFAYRFSTKPVDFTTGLYYYGYRWYDPLTGRWPSRDPLGEKGGMNLYGFVGNDGIGFLDLLGLTWEMIGYPQRDFIALGSRSLEEPDIVEVAMTTFSQDCNTKKQSMLDTSDVHIGPNPIAKRASEQQQTTVEYLPLINLEVVESPMYAKDGTCGHAMIKINFIKMAEGADVSENIDEFVWGGGGKRDWSRKYANNKGWSFKPGKVDNKDDEKKMSVSTWTFYIHWNYCKPTHFLKMVMFDDSGHKPAFGDLTREHRTDDNKRPANGWEDIDTKEGTSNDRLIIHDNRTPRIWKYK